MLLRMSSLFVRTLREDPAEAEVASHKLLVRAGYVRRAAPGGYTWLPLGMRVQEKIKTVIREEMVAIGGQEVVFPSLLPREPYETSGRWTEYGPDIFRLRDRRDADFLLGPTHEEMFALLVKDLYSSYKDYPVTLFQVGTKFRDEQRPRAGILRTREFIMKDSYSFDLTDDGLAASYAAHRAAYRNMFDRLGLTYTIVSAISGAMGGSASEEFLARADAGEDTYVGCTTCDYAANTEAVVTPVPSVTPVDHPPMAVHDTPDTPTIESLVTFARERALGGRTDWTAADTLKNVVVTVRPPDGKPSLLMIGVPGDREVDLKRLAAAMQPAEVELFTAFDTEPDLVKGYIGPGGAAGKVRFLADPRVAPGTAWLTGANEPGRHAVNVVCGRDFTPDGTIEAAEVRAGDACPSCGTGSLTLRRGIEIGHIFQLGRRYTDAFGLDALGPDGKPIRITMGSYGIGVTRLVGVIAEQHHDDRGLIWPAAVAPADVHVVATGTPQLAAALELAASLGDRDVLVDDRPGVSAGVKFTDAELIGIPVVVVVGRRHAEGIVEVRDRAAGTRTEVPMSDLPAFLAAR